MPIQIIFNSVISASILLLLGLSFSLSFRITRFFNMAHGVFFIVGPYLTTALIFRIPLISAVLIGIILAITAACLIEMMIYRPLRRRRASSLALLLTSMGIYIIAQNVICLIFGDRPITLRTGYIVEGIHFGGARITQVQILTILTSILAILATAVLYTKMRLGKTMKCVASNPDQALLSGISIDRVVIISSVLSSLLATIAGLLIALDVPITPSSGMSALLAAVVVTVIAGSSGNLTGLIVGALFIGVMKSVLLLKLGAQWQDVLVFAILLISFIFRPNGIFGRKIRKAEI